MKKIYLLLVFALPYTFAATAQECPPASQPKPLFGVHPQLEFSNLWNMVNSGYGANYGNANMGNAKIDSATIYLGQDGWPKAGVKHSFYINLDTSVNTNLIVKIGDVLKCSYKGKLSQLGNGTATQNFGGATLQQVVEANGYVTFELKVAQLKAAKFVIDGHIEDVQIMRPSYTLNDTRLLTDECKAHHKGAQVLRMMGESGCNQNFERKWNHRTPANSPFINLLRNGEENDIKSDLDNCFDERGSNPWLTNSFNQTRSYPWEKAIDVCNYMNMDFYANLPVLMDLDYANQLGKLLKQRLNPNLNVYIEIGNELWNFGGGGAFFGFAMEFAAVHNMVMVQRDTTIKGGFNNLYLDKGPYGNGTFWTGGMSAYYAARRWPAYRLKQFMDEFAKSWGFAAQGGVGARVRTVLAGQKDYGSGGDYWFIGEEGLGFIDKAFGRDAVKKYIYAIAVDGYFSAYFEEYNNPKILEELKNMPASEILLSLNKDLELQFGEYGLEGDCRENPNGNCEGNELEDILAYSKYYGVKTLANEGGPEISMYSYYFGNYIPLANINEVYSSPEMYTLIKKYMNKWYSWMGADALFIKNGYYTQKDYSLGYAVAAKMGEESQQYKAYKDVMNTPAPAMSTERGVILGNVDSLNYPAGKVASYMTKDVKNGFYSVSSFYDLEANIQFTKARYIIHNTGSGKYSVKLKYNYATQHIKLNVYLDGILVKSEWFISNEFSDKIYLTKDSVVVDIPYGTHVLSFELNPTIIPPKNNSHGIRLHTLQFRLLKNNPACSPLSAEVADEIAEKTALQVVPNPSDGNITISTTDPSTTLFRVVDMQGRQLLEQPISTAKPQGINLSNYPKGMYYIYTNGKYTSKKIVIQ